MRKFLAGVALCFLGFTHPFTPSFLQPRDIQVRGPANMPAASQSDSQPPQNGGKTSALALEGVQSQAISLPHIADRAQELNHLLRQITSQLTPVDELLQANKQAEAQTSEIRARALQAKDLMLDNPTPVELEDEQRYWRALSDEYRGRRKVLAALAVKLQEQIQILNTQLPEWEATWDRIRELTGVDVVLEQVRNSVEAIRATRLQLDDQLKLVLIIQNEVSQQDQQISDTLLSVRQLRERELSYLLEPDSPPLWKAGVQAQTNETVRTVFYRSWHRSLATAREFLKTHKRGALGIVACYLLVFLGVWKLRSQIDTVRRIDVLPDAIRAMQRPYSLALLLALVLTIHYAGSAPIAITFVFHLLYVVPVVRLLAPMIDSNLRRPLYIATVAYVVMGLYLLVQLPPSMKRALHAVVVLALLVSFGWIEKLIRTQRSQVGRTALGLWIGVRACLLLLVASLIANVAGFASLAQLLSLPALVGPFVAAALYCAMRVIAPLLNTLLHLPSLKNVPDLEVNVNLAEHWVHRVLRFGVIFLWTVAMLHLLTIYDQVRGAISDLVHAPIGFERVHFTLAGAFMVIAIVLAGYILANALTFFLQNFVLARWRLKRGLPFAISKVTYYACLVLVGLAALSAAGIELNKFTVLTGALGVGLGFGMQNIVNNFVSGLILIFERPIHVGDVVDVGGLEGTVRRIGARSSTVVTFQGAEVIVPNSNLLSNQLINWTLSSPWRRIDIPVRVAYGTEPEQLIKILVGVAESNPGVLLQRPPVAFFRGFGESALNFELRFWSAQQDTLIQLHSDVTVAVAKALREAGIEIPFPQRDLHVRSMDLLTASALRQSIHESTIPEASEHSVRR